MGSIASLAIGVPAISQNMAPSELVAGFYGAVTHEVPISIPKHFGITPPVSLRYSSAAPNGPAGVGWTLSGVSSIQRTAPRGGSPLYTGTDWYHLDGQKLVPSTVMGGTHCTEIQNFSRIDFNQAANEWTVIARNGTRTVYEPLMTTPSGTYRWSISTVTDVHGNQVTYSYEVDFSTFASDAYRLDEITYNGCVVDFYYESRPDPISYAIGDGRPAQHPSRLYAIKVVAYGSTARTYHLEYEASPLTERSLLKSVTQLGTDSGVAIFGQVFGTALPPMTFEYAPGTDALVDQGVWGSTSFTGVNDELRGRGRQGDFDGDGRMDLLHGPTDDGDWYVSLSQGTGFGTGGADMFDLWIANTHPWWASDPTRSARIRVADVDADGRSDVVVGPNPDGKWYVMRSTGSGFVDAGEWASGNYGQYYSNNALAAAAMDIVDMNGDGRADICLGLDGAGTIHVLLSNGTSFQDAGEWFHDSTMTNWGTPETAQSRVRLIDMTGDGFPDMLVGPDSNGTIWLLRNKGNGFEQSKENWSQTMTTSLSWWSSNERAGALTRLADVNGDGLTDMILVGNSSVSVAVNQGNGFMSVGGTNLPVQDMKVPDNAQARLRVADVNGDRRADLIYGPHVDGHFYVMSGNGWWLHNRGVWAAQPFSDITVHPYVHHNGNCTTRLRTMDVTGDGISDFVYGPADNGDYHVLRSGTDGNPGDLLTGIHNGIGGTSTIEYATSTEFSHTYMPTGMVLQVVDSVTTDDGRGNSSTSSFEYQGGLWSDSERRFLGFRRVTSVLDGTGNYSETFYHQRNGSISKPEQIRHLDPGGIPRTVISYAYTENPTAPFTSLMTETWRSESERPNSSTSIQSRQNYGYDGYGNAVWAADHGNVSLLGDERLTVTEFVPNVADYIVSLPARITQYDGISPGDPLLGDARYIYDQNTSYLQAPTKGSATVAQKWDDQTGNLISSSMIYDQYGNVTERTDETGLFTTVTTYDPVSHVFPVSVTNPLGHSESREWDRTIAQVTKFTDLNGFSTDFEYDVHGRLERTSDSTGFSETIQNLDTGNPQLQRVRTLRVTSLSPLETHWTEQYLDGLGRTWKSVKQGPTPQSIGNRDTVRSEIEYDGASERQKRASAPAYTNQSLIWTEYEYDARGRVCKAISPSGDEVTTEFSVDSEFRVVKESTSAAGSKALTKQDHRGNVVEVVEFLNGAELKTRYFYDALDRLIKVIDSEGNVSQTFWDSLGRKVMTDDPDLGVLTYDHDPRGLEVISIDNGGKMTTGRYDALGRATAKFVNGNVVARMYYDQPGHGAGVGRMTSTWYPEGGVSYVFDSSGRVVQETIRVGTVSKVFGRAYDLIGRVKSVTYPDGEVDSYGYDPSGNLKSTSAAMESMFWSADNRLTSANYRDASRDQYAYDPLRRWVDGVQIYDGHSQLQLQTEFNYDADGRLESQTSPTHADDNLTYGYDDLGRLTSVTGARKESFLYDGIGNMLANSNAGRMQYGENGSGPHAMTTLTTFRGEVLPYTYDACGNLLTRGPWTYTWDLEDRLSSATARRNGVIVSHSEFGYDALGNRVRETVGTRTTLHFGGLLEVHLDTGVVVDEVKLYHAGQRLVAKKSVTSPNLEVLHMDDRSSVRLVTSVGVVKEMNYKAFGGLMRGSTVANDVEHGYGGHRLDAQTGLIYMKARFYDPAIGRFLSPDSVIPGPMNPQALNRYSYVLNNPIANTDPTGHVPVAAALFSAITVTASASATASIIGVAWLGAAVTTYGYFNEDATLLTIGQILTGFASGYTGNGANSAWGEGLSGGVHSAVFAYSQSPASPLSPRAKMIVGWAFVETGNFGDGVTRADLTSSQIQSFQNDSIRRLVVRLGIDRAESITGLDPGTISGAISGLGTLRDAALWMRNQQIAGHTAEDKHAMRQGHSAGAATFWGFSYDEYKLGGQRNASITLFGFLKLPIPTSGPLGGSESLGGTLFGYRYEAGSIVDRLIEAFAGPHDFLNSVWYYGPDGRQSSNAWGSLLGPLDWLPNWINLVPAAPFGAATLLAPPHLYWNTNY